MINKLATVKLATPKLKLKHISSPARFFFFFLLFTFKHFYSCMFSYKSIPVSFFVWLSVSADISLNYSWILQQWHHCVSFHALWSLDVCHCAFCLCTCGCVVNCSIKTSHCVPTARLFLSCFREEGKTGRIWGDKSIGSGRTSPIIHNIMTAWCWLPRSDGSTRVWKQQTAVCSTSFWKAVSCEVDRHETCLSKLFYQYCVGRSQRHLGFLWGSVCTISNRG